MDGYSEWQEGLQMNRAERRRSEREYRKAQGRGPIPTFSGGHCSFPQLFQTEGCCICGNADAQACPCTAMDALVHLEREHPRLNSASMRTALGCTIRDSKRVPSGPPGASHQGEFQAPCGDMVIYATEYNFPTMGHFRWHAVYDHVAQGVCRSPEMCSEGLNMGNC